MSETYLSSFFSDAHIEYYASLPIEHCELKTEWFARRHITFTPKSVLLYLIPYYVTEGENLSAYATSRDYHLFAKMLGEQLKEGLSSLYPNEVFLPLCDASPLNERMAAAKAGLGVLGDNGLLINEKYGSYVFIGEMLSTMSAEAYGCFSLVEPKECLHCGACQSACKTGFLCDSSRPCLSSLTQKKGTLTKEEIAYLVEGEMVWGCDTCQMVCPLNQGAGELVSTPIPFFYFDRVTTLSEELLDKMDDATFSSYAFSWRGRDVLKRNLTFLQGKSM